MSSETDTLLQLLDGKSKVTPLVGTFVSATATKWTVDTGGGRVTTCLPVTAYIPEVNEPVWVFWIDGTPYVLGPTVSKPDRGVVISVAGGLVRLTTAFGIVEIPYSSTLAPTAGQTMKITWSGGGFAIAVMSNSPAAPVPPPAPGGGAVAHSDVFTAVDTGSFNGSWSTAMLYASNTYLGAAFYGSKIKDTIPSGAVITSLEVYIAPNRVEGANPNFALHNHLTRPGGAPALSSSTPIAVTGGWLPLPTGWGDALKAGGGSAGIGLNHGGYNIFKSLTQDGMSFALRVGSNY